jgi:hypothetical protein
MHDEVTLVGDMIKLLSRDKLVDAQHRNALDRI